jgi:hypothetical protein
MQALEVRAKSRQCLCPEANAAASIRAGRFKLQFEFADFFCKPTYEVNAAFANANSRVLLSV